MQYAATKALWSSRNYHYFGSPCSASSMVKMQASILLSVMTVISSPLIGVQGQDCSPRCPVGTQCDGQCVDATPGPCPAGQVSLLNVCIAKSPRTMCTPACTAQQECIAGMCVTRGQGCADCGGPNDACVNGCAPTQNGVCRNFPCTATQLCVPACVTPPPTPPSRCVDPRTGGLSANATACQDTTPAEQCKAVFKTPYPEGPVAPPSSRPVECDNALLKQVALKCAKTCAICCELPNNGCGDSGKGGKGGGHGGHGGGGKKGGGHGRNDGWNDGYGDWGHGWDDWGHGGGWDNSWDWW